MKKKIAFSLLVGMMVLATGCGNKGADSNGRDRIDTNTPDSVTVDSTDGSQEVDEPYVSQDANSSNFNHGHSIDEAGGDRFREIDRSYDLVIHDSNEAKDYLLDNIQPQDSKISLKLTDTSDDDLGAYMWYEFTVYYDNIIVEGANFTVIAFTDGSIIEGRTEVFDCSFADRNNILSSDDIIDNYKTQYYDDRDYDYVDEYYYFSGGFDECPYVYVYRHDSTDVLDCITLTLNAKTGERVGYRPDAID